MDAKIKDRVTIIHSTYALDSNKREAEVAQWSRGPLFGMVGSEFEN
jgi:hypothetical protein